MCLTGTPPAAGETTSCSLLPCHPRLQNVLQLSPMHRRVVRRGRRASTAVRCTYHYRCARSVLRYSCNQPGTSVRIGEVCLSYESYQSGVLLYGHVDLEVSRTEYRPDPPRARNPGNTHSTHNRPHTRTAPRPPPPSHSRPSPPPHPRRA